MKRYQGFLLVAAVGWVAPLTWGQVSSTPFYGAGVTGYDPVVAVVNSGMLLDAQATVSPDRKYVTINMRPTNSRLLALQAFAFQTGGSNVGYVGGVSFGAGSGKSSKSPPAGPAPSSPPATHHPVLNQPGMTRISQD